MERLPYYECDFNSTAYALGWEAWDVHYESNYTITPKNPFKELTQEYYDWNMGWTTNFKGI